MNQIKRQLAACMGFLLFNTLLIAQDTLHFSVDYHQAFGPESQKEMTTSAIHFKCAMARTREQIQFRLTDITVNMYGNEVNLEEMGTTELNYRYQWQEPGYQLAERDTILLDALAEFPKGFLFFLTINPDMFPNGELEILSTGEEVEFDREIFRLDSMSQDMDMMQAGIHVFSYSKALREQMLALAEANSSGSTISEKEIVVELPDGKMTFTGVMEKHGKYLYHLKDKSLEMLDINRVVMPFMLEPKDNAEKMVNEFALVIKRIRE